MSQVPIPTRKPPVPSDFNTQNSAGGFIDSLLSNAKRFTDSAFDVSYNAIRIQQLFENRDDIFVDDQPTSGGVNPTQVSNPQGPFTAVTGGNISQTTMIGLALGAVGLFLLLDK